VRSLCGMGATGALRVRASCRVPIPALIRAVCDAGMRRVIRCARVTEGATSPVKSLTGRPKMQGGGALPALWSAIEQRIAIENLLNPLRIDLDLEATPFELEQHG